MFSITAMGDAVVALLAPGSFSNLIWPHRTGPEADQFVRGWGSCLMALGLFAYHLAASISWFVDALSHGWTPLSAASFGALVLFTLGFAYFEFTHSDGATERVKRCAA